MLLPFSSINCIKISLIKTTNLILTELVSKYKIRRSRQSYNFKIQKYSPGPASRPRPGAGPSSWSRPASAPGAERSVGYQFDPPAVQLGVVHLVYGALHVVVSGEIDHSCLWNVYSVPVMFILIEFILVVDKQKRFSIKNMFLWPKYNRQLLFKLIYNIQIYIIVAIFSLIEETFISRINILYTKINMTWISKNNNYQSY